jgi:nitroreductase/catechol 2,3-dioxygenase-like lactoylglutathione lyase family enzyme
MLAPLTPRRFLSGLARILRGRPQPPPALRDNALLATLLNRRSVRSFAPDPIPDDVFAAILEAGRLAPSTVNLQTWSFAVFTAAEWGEKFGQPLPFKAQRGIIILADTHRARAVLDVFPRSPLVEYTIGVMNASLAAMAMNAAAEALGVGSVMLSETGRTGLLDAGYLAEQLALPSGVVPLMTIVFGYARPGLRPMPPKLPLRTVAFTGEYREADKQDMADWLDAMMAGYAASNLGSSLNNQLGVYESKIGQAEADLRRMVLGQEEGRALSLVTLVVRDYDEAIAFFTGPLGFALLEDAPLGDGKRWVRVGPHAAGGALLLACAVTPEQAAAIGNQTGGRVAFVLRTDDFERDYARMKAAGVRFTEEPRREAYGRVVVFLDICGNKWDLIGPASRP